MITNELIDEEDYFGRCNYYITLSHPTAIKILYDAKVNIDKLKPKCYKYVVMENINDFKRVIRLSGSDMVEISTRSVSNNNFSRYFKDPTYKANACYDNVTKKDILDNIEEIKNEFSDTDNDIHRVNVLTYIDHGIDINIIYDEDLPSGYTLVYKIGSNNISKSWYTFKLLTIFSLMKGPLEPKLTIEAHELAKILFDESSIVDNDMV